MRLLVLFWCCLYLTTSLEAARILCYFAFPSVSHQNVFRAFWKGLAVQGHEVVVLTPNPLKDPTLKKLKEIDLSSTFDVVKNFPLVATFSADKSYIDKTTNIFKLTTKVLEHQFNLPVVKEFFNNKSQKFDLVIIHSFFMPSLYALSYKYEAPIIGMISFGLPLQVHDSVGNPTHPVLHPDLLLGLGDELNFFERWYSTYNSILYRINYHFNILPEHDKFARKYFGNDLPYIAELERNVSMQFMNVNPILYSPRPNVPAVVELRQLHLNPVKPLPQDLKTILDNAKEGVIYLSLGSNVKSTNIDDHLLKTILSALGDLPYKILMKFEADKLPGKPSNVIIRKWLPQQDVLAHPNVKAFITQGGLQSVEEAVNHEVPLIVIPFLAEQPMNAVKLAKAGIAINLDKNKLTKEVLKNAILEVVQDQKYRLKVKEVKNILNDEPMTSLEKAIWWCEYVIRHKGAKHLRSPTLEIPLYQYFLLDVIGATLLVVISVIYLIVKLVNISCRLIFGKKIKVKRN